MVLCGRPVPAEVDHTQIVCPSCASCPPYFAPYLPPPLPFRFPAGPPTSLLVCRGINGCRDDRGSACCWVPMGVQSRPGHACQDEEQGVQGGGGGEKEVDRRGERLHTWL